MATRLVTRAHSMLSKHKVINNFGVYRLKNRARYFDLAIIDQEN